MGPPIGSPLLFIRGAMCVKSKSFFAEYGTADREPLTFCTQCYACKKPKFFLIKGPPIGSPLLFVCGAMHVKSLSFFE
jgi:hypothetical protein